VRHEHDYKCYPDPAISERWVKTEGLKGYTTWDLKDDYEKLAEGWMTGWSDDTVTRKIDFNNFCGQLERGEIKTPEPIYMIFGDSQCVHHFHLYCSCYQ
jgi:hypothetical protein